ncbi:putative protein, contains BSD domain [Handroanthus impetiginosus]|uniref:BSD domain-containing protein n=1 Tax=Handroanthus impetiginosus TaxID=429701 RepID=A0A2G9FYX9_9LAMI|nr:putative protein, contains BSD domain [Handroanthus impetiginosus]
MNFFKSILSDDPEPPKEEAPHETVTNSPHNSSQEDHNSDDVAQEGNADLWSFGGFIKTLASRSSVIETYSRDLKEFGSGLRKESEIIREAASRAVKDLPASLEAGSSAAHGVLDGVLKSTVEIISKESQLFASDGESETPEINRSLNAGRYSWFETQLSGIHSDLNTFCEEPEDVEEYKKWRSSFELEGRRDEIEELIGENGALESVYKRVVPSEVDHETFWCRYFYRVDKLKQQEMVRANLVRRAISVDDDDDELSWDVDDDDAKDGNGSELTSDVKAKGDGAGKKGVIDGSSNGTREEKDVDNFDAVDGDKNDVVESSKKSSGDVSIDEKEVKSDEVAGTKSDEKVKSEESVKENKDNENVGVEKGAFSGKGDVSAVSNHQAKMEEEEDLGWDEIEDIGSGDEKKILTTNTDRPNRPELKKQLTPTDDDEDLSWDIEDDDEPVKS